MVVACHFASAAVISSLLTSHMRVRSFRKGDLDNRSSYYFRLGDDSHEVNVFVDTGEHGNCLSTRVRENVRECNLFVGSYRTGNILGECTKD